MSNLSHVGVCIREAEYEWLWNQICDNNEAEKLLCEGRDEAFECPLDGYVYLYWDEINWSEKYSPTKEIISNLYELSDSEIIVVYENGEIEERHSLEHEDMLTLIDDYCIDFDLGCEEE